MKERSIFLLAFLFMIMTVMCANAQQTTVQVIPASYTVPNVGLTFNVNITVQNVENLYGYAFKLYYPNDMLNGTTVTEGPFLKTGGFQTFFSIAQFTDNYNATYGLVNVLSLRTGNVTGANGSGTLVVITFKSTSTNGPRTLQLADVALSDPNPAAIPCITTNGQVTVVPEFPTALILPLLIIATSVTLTLTWRKKKLEK